MASEPAPATASTQAPTNRRWLMFSLAAGTSSFLYLHRYTFGVIRPELEKEYGFSNTELDSIFALFNLTYALGQIPGGIICDFFGPHLFLAGIILTWSIVLPFVALTGSLTGLGVARLTFGAAQAGCYPSLAKATRVWFPAKTRTIMQGLIASFFGRGGGAMAAIVMSSFLMGLCGLTWRGSLVVMALGGVAFAAIFLKYFRNSPDTDPHTNDAERALIREGQVPVEANLLRCPNCGEKSTMPDSTCPMCGHVAASLEAAVEEAKKEGSPVLPWKRALRNRSLLVFIVQQFMNAGADMIYILHLGSYLRNHYGVVDNVKFGFLLSLPLWGGACGGIAGGFINDGLIQLTGNRRWSRTAVGFTGKFLACFFLYFAATANDPVTASWLLFGTKFFSDWTQPTVWGTSTDMGGRYSGTVFSIINSSGSLAGFIIPIVGGVLLDQYVTEKMVGGELIKTTHYEPVFLLVGAMYLLSAVCWLFINCTNSLDPDEERKAA